ncbi:MAG TPA: uL22 family ribosomal protein [Vampirovibrionales bacterium]
MSTKQAKTFNKKAVAQVMIKGSVDKMKRPLNEVREKKLEEAMTYLQFSDFIASSKVAKLIKSAASNALNLNEGLQLSDLYVSKIWATQSLVLRRFKAGPKGRGRPIKKRYSQVFVELGVLENK